MGNKTKLSITVNIDGISSHGVIEIIGNLSKMDGETIARTINDEIQKIFARDLNSHVSITPVNGR